MRWESAVELHTITRSAWRRSSVLCLFHRQYIQDHNAHACCVIGWTMRGGQGNSNNQVYLIRPQSMSKQRCYSSTTPYLRQEGHRHGACHCLDLCGRCCKDAGAQEAAVTQAQCDEHCTYVGTSSQCCPARCWCHILCEVGGVKQLQQGTERAGSIVVRAVQPWMERGIC
jgi:hypothetical protein